LSLLLAPWVFWQNRIFAVFSGIFSESRISAQKRDTRAILLKTALVRVSCIQNTQIRGETLAKVFGKVDTFWTYQGPIQKEYGQESMPVVQQGFDLLWVQVTTSAECTKSIKILPVPGRSYERGRKRAHRSSNQHVKTDGHSSFN
jgi:hypothetical protein